MSSNIASKTRPLMVIGWQECIKLPELGLDHFAVKIDTGAKTTALHADDIALFRKDAAAWVRCTCPSIDDTPPRLCEFPVHTQRDITNTGGTPETRIVIRTPMVLARRRWKIDISLTDRGSMRFPLILGRRALRRKSIAVHPGQTYLVSTPPPNRGTNP